MRAGLATAAALAAVTTTVAASTITCSDQIKRKQRDNEVSHPCSQRTKQNKHNRWSVCSNRNIFGSSTFHFSHCDLSFGFKLGGFHMLSIVFADLWTNKTFGVFIEFTEVSAIFNRLGDQISHSLLLLSKWKWKQSTHELMSWKKRHDHWYMRSNRSFRRTIDRLFGGCHSIFVHRKSYAKEFVTFIELNGSIPKRFFTEQTFNSMLVKSKQIGFQPVWHAEHRANCTFAVWSMWISWQ